MNGAMMVYHYFSDPLLPFRSYSGEPFLDVRQLADYAAKVEGMRMVGYDAAYFQKRLSRERRCRQLVEAAYGAVNCSYPVYCTLGKADKEFFRERNHRFSVALPIPQGSTLPMLFCVGDSMCGDEESAFRRIFTREEFSRLSPEEIQKLMPPNSWDQYVEVQLWADFRTFTPLPPEDSPLYFSRLSQEVLQASGQNYPMLAEISMDFIRRKLREKGLFAPFCRLVQTADLSVIPPGRIHGIPHSLRCGFLAYLMALEEGFDTQTALWISRCGAYHDCGRLLSAKEHARMARYMAGRVFAPVEAEDAYRVMRCHGETPEFIAAYFGDDSQEQQLAAIARIVHDADSLDYLRFATESGIGSYDGGRLCREASRKWIGFALEMVLYSLSSRDWIFQYFS